MKNEKQPEQLILFDVPNIYYERIIKYLDEKIAEKQVENKQYIKTVAIKDFMKCI